jgi:hypothetical protein
MLKYFHSNISFNAGLFSLQYFIGYLKNFIGIFHCLLGYFHWDISFNAGVFSFWYFIGYLKNFIAIFHCLLGYFHCDISFNAGLFSLRYFIVIMWWPNHVVMWLPDIIQGAPPCLGAMNAQAISFPFQFSSINNWITWSCDCQIMWSCDYQTMWSCDYQTMWLPDIIQGARSTDPGYFHFNFHL